MCKEEIPSSSSSSSSFFPPKNLSVQQELLLISSQNYCVYSTSSLYDHIQNVFGGKCKFRVFFKDKTVLITSELCNFYYKIYTIKLN